MISVKIDAIATTNMLNDYQQALKNAPGIMATLTKRRTQRSTSRLLKALQVEPENLPDLPFVWSYNPEKQNRARRWYFANVVKGKGGGRYQRTHKLAKSWKILVKVDANGGMIEAVNNAPGADYVIGDRQVPSHYLTGWPGPKEIDDILLKEAVILEDQLSSDWITANDPYAGVG